MAKNEGLGDSGACKPGGRGVDFEHRERDLTHHSHCSARNKMLQDTARHELCLSQIPSLAGVGRRIVAPIQVFELRFVGSKGEAREIDAALGETRRSLVLSGIENRHSRPWIGLAARIAVRSGCASLVAVVKSANFWYGNDASECRWVHGPRFRCVLAQREVRPGFVIIRQE